MGNKGRIICVVKDFHFQSLQEPIRPFVFIMNDTLSQGYALVRTEPGRTKDAVSSIEKVYNDLEPKFPITYSFADEEYRRLYESEQLVGSLSKGFALLAIFISCLGLFGLAMFTAQQRTKEIGIRKIHGATEIKIIQLLSKEFLQLVCMAFAVGAPIAWLIADGWLQNYAYRINLSWPLFVIGGIITLFISLITILFQVVKASLANPIKSLRTE
jgi:putative ABC transport system permease protein